MAEKSLVWKGKAVTARMRAAQIEGVNRTMGACVVHAKDNHNWKNRTGVLEGGIDVVTYAHEDDMGVIGVWGVHDVKYALIHELGGTIEPKNAKFLAIPVTETAGKKGSPRNMPNLKYAQSEKGQPLLVDATTGMVHYVLRKHVTIPARPYLRPAADVKYPELAGNIRKAWDKYKPGSRGTGDGDA